MKVCKKCGESKPLEEFYKHARTRDGRWGSCKVCCRSDQQNWRVANPELLTEGKRDYHLRKNYGITLKEFESLLLAQGGVCACCSSDKQTGVGKDFYVDHDHTTGRIRGLLCHHCNAGIGMLGDTVEGVSMALAYLLGVD